MNRLIAITSLAAALAALPASTIHAQEARDMQTSTQDLAAVQRLVDLHFAIWNDGDSRHWPAKFEQAYTADVTVADYAGQATGYAAVSQLLQRVQGGHAGFRFTPGPAAWNHGIGRVTWGYGPQDQPGLIRGEDIFTIRDGRLATLHVFIDKQ